MSYQTTVSLQAGFGVVGDIYLDSPSRVQSYILESANAANNVFGNAFTIVSQGIAQAGGTGIYAGILVNPKSSPSVGAGGAPLNPTLTLPNYYQAEIATMGSFIVYLPAAANIGDLVVFNTTTGALSTIPPSGTLPVGTAFAFAAVDYYSISGAGLAVITLTPTLVIPA